MKNKVYLTGLEWTRTTHDNMGGVEGNIVFKDNMHYEEYQRLAEGFFILCDEDYITNIQKHFNVKVIKYYKLLEKYYKELRRIDKAIEYIENQEDYFYNYPLIDRENVLNILKGDN